MGVSSAPAAFVVDESPKPVRPGVEVGRLRPMVASLLAQRATADRDLKRQRGSEERHWRGFYLEVLKVIDAFESILRSTDFTALDEMASNRLRSVRTATNLLADVLEQEDVIAMDDPTGGPFDTALHEAAGRVIRPDLEDETVTEVRQRGYLHGSRVLRRARVIVSLQSEPSS